MTVEELIDFLEANCDMDERVLFQGANEWTEGFLIQYNNDVQAYQIIGCEEHE